MIEFSNLIKITPTELTDGKSYDFISDPFSYIPQLTESDAGNFWNCDKTIVIDTPSDDVRRFFAIERSAIVTLYTSDRKSHNIGTQEIPAKVQISANLTTANLVIKCKMLSHPL